MILEESDKDTVAETWIRQGTRKVPGDAERADMVLQMGL